MGKHSPRGFTPSRHFPGGLRSATADLLSLVQDLSWLSRPTQAHGRSGRSLYAHPVQRNRHRLGFLLMCSLLISGWIAHPSSAQQASPATASPASAPDPQAAKPRVAIFPISGSASASAREKVAFSIRSKLDRTGLFEVIDGPMMSELSEMLPQPADASTKPQDLKKIAALEKGDILAWGTLTQTGPSAMTLKLLIWDTRQPGPPQSMELSIKAATDLRFVSEKIVESFPGVGVFDHPSEEAVTRDPQAEQLWKTQPNLLINGDFSAAGNWTCLYQSEVYPLAIAQALPEPDQITIIPLSLLGNAPAQTPAATTQAMDQILAMNLSRTAAENNGLACLSDAMKIKPNTRYRLQFRYRSDGPRLHVFVKGYTLAKDAAGNPAMREVYRRQVPPTDATDGQWVTIDCDLNPQHVAFPVQELRVDLYAYLHPGMVYFDDVVLKEVGAPTRIAHDEALDKPNAPRGNPPQKDPAAPSPATQPGR